jgi:hypothetical protein
MKKIILSILFSGIMCLCYSQKNNIKFPNNVLGIYKGDLKINTSKGSQIIPMEFHIRKTDSIHKFDYVIIYNNSPRNYTLVVKDIEKGLFEIDENNGIILPTKLSNNILYSFFEVQDNFLSSRLEFKDDFLIFEILFTQTKNKITTGGTSKEVPPVFGFPISTIQKAILKKQNN